MLVTDDGITICRTPLYAKAAGPMALSPSGRRTVSRDVSPRKASSPISRSPAGRVSVSAQADMGKSSTAAVISSSIANALFKKTPLS